MGEKYIYYLCCSDYRPTRRTMREIKSDFNKNLQKHSLSKTKRKQLWKQ